MSVVGGTSSTGLVSRVQNMIMKPAAEWDVVSAEPATVGSIYTGYAMILAAIPAIASLFSSILFLHVNPIVAIVGAVITYVLGLLGVFISAFIIDALAPSFGGQKSQVQALKLVVYGNTAYWLAGIANIIPMVGGLVVIVGFIYTLYTVYVGLPKVMKNPADKTVGYFVVSLIVEILVVGLIVLVIGGALTLLLVGVLGAGAMAGGSVH